MRRLLLALLTSCWIVLAPTAALGHVGGSAFILVPADHVLPGQPFEVVAADISPNATIELSIVVAEESASLGSVTTDDQGHFATTLLLPADYPTGYAQLFATATDGTQTSTWVLVGARTASTPPPPLATQWLLDPSVLVLVAFAVGIVGVFGYLFLKRGKPAARPAAAHMVPLARSRARKRRMPR